MKDNPQPTYEQQQSYYDRRWFNHPIWMLAGDDKCRLEFIKQTANQLRITFGRKLRIIDLGCGRGWISHTLSKHHNVVGVDLSTATAERLYPNLRFIKANIVTDDILGQYDVVISSEVIEHLTSDDQRTYLLKASSLLTDGGYLILTTPNRPIVETLFKEVPRAQRHRQPIENWLNQESLTSLLISNFKVVYFGSVVFYPIKVRKSPYLNALYFLLYADLGLFRLLDKSRMSGLGGLYLTVLACKTASLTL